MVPFRRPEILAAITRGLLCRRKLRLHLAVCIGLQAWASLSGQSPVDGIVQGVVIGPRGAPVAGAPISVRATDGVVHRDVKSGADGRFSLIGLEPGEYGISIGSGLRGSTLPVQIGVGAAETTEVRVSLTISGSVIESTRPTNSDLNPDENADGLESARGLEPMQNGASADGIGTRQSFGSVPMGTGSDPAPDPDGDADSDERTTGPANGISRGRHGGLAYSYAQASVREFHVAGKTYSAAMGRAGDVVGRVTRGGGSELHGSGFLTLRSQAFAAYDPLAIATSYTNGATTSMAVKPHDLRVAFGVATGGPVPRLRGVNFFYSLDVQRRGFPAVSSPADPNFYTLTAMQVALLGNRGVTPAQTGAGLSYLSSLTGVVARRADQTIHFGRVDWQVHPRTSVAVEYNRVRWDAPAGLINSPVVARGRASIGNSSGSLDMVLGRVTTTLSARTINRARAAYLGDVQFETPQTPLPQEAAISPGGLAPEVNIGPNGLLFGTPQSLSQAAYPEERRAAFADTLTLQRGRHLLEVGGEVSFVHDRVATLANAAGTFVYDSGATNGKAGGLVDFLTDYTFNVHSAAGGGCPSIFAVTHLFCFRSFSQSFGGSETAFSTSEWAGFAEDTWRLRAGLTIHVGARYEYQLLPVPVAPNRSLDTLLGTRGATSVFPEDRNNLAPRLAVSWEPFGMGHGLVRVGYGVFFGQVPGATIQAALTDTGLTSSTTRARIRPSTSVVCPQALTSGFGYPCAFTAQPPGVVAATTSATVFDRHFRQPMVQQAFLSLEANVGWNTKAAATYLVNADRQLPGSVDLNILPSTATGTFQLQDGETFRVPVYTSRVTPTFGPVTDVVSNVNASYNGLTLTLEKRSPRNLDLRASYTWSKAIDFGQAQSAIPRTNGQFDPFTKGYDKARSSLDYPHALRITATWEPEPKLGPQWFRRSAVGWSVVPILVARSGRPYSFDVSGGTFLPGGHTSLNGSGGALYLPTVGRNTLRLPAVVNIDLRAGRIFHVGRVRMVATAEAFNMLNHPVISSVTQRAYLAGAPASGVTPLVFQSAAAIAAEGLTTQPFGTRTATGTNLARERQVLFGLRVQF